LNVSDPVCPVNPPLPPAHKKGAAPANRPPNGACRLCLTLPFPGSWFILELIGVMQNDTLYIIHTMKLRKQFYHLLAEAKDD
jgi:hypothetical protein